MTSAEALQELEDGNARFRERRPTSPGMGGVVPAFSDLSAGQSPFAAILGCSDSRVPVEVVFDQGPGELFVVRVAGNVAGPTQVGSLEFAVEELGVSLILVLGHTHCGAVTAALRPAHKRKWWMASRKVESITGQISRSLERGGGRGRSGPGFSVPEAVRLNVTVTCENLRNQSEILSARVSSGGLRILGAVYDLEDGQVEFLESG